MNHVILRKIPHFPPRVSIVICVLCLAGCGGELPAVPTVDDLKNAVQGGAKQAQQLVQETAQPSGSIALVLDGPVNTLGCHVTLVTVGSDLPAVLKISSYSSSDAEAFPSVLIQAQVKAASINDLVGQTVAAQVYLQAAADGPVLSPVAGAPVQIKISSVAEGVVKGEFISGSLVASDGTVSRPVAGTFCGTLSQ